MFSRFCNNSILPSPTHTTPARRQLPALPGTSENFTTREPPPPYSLHRNISGQIEVQRQRRPAPVPPRESNAPRSRSEVQQITRSRFEQFRNRVFVSDSDSDEDRGRRQRISPPQRNTNGFKNEVLLDEDVFCPDVLRNCKSLPVVDDDQDYIEIEELTAQLSLHNEVGLPKVSEKVKNPIMGQHVSLRRPKISLTWVLREQQNQSHLQQKKSLAATDKIQFKKNAKPKEKLFSEKYENEKILTTEIRGPKLNEDRNQKFSELGKSERTKKFREKCCGQRQSPESSYDQLEVSKAKSLSQANLSTKNTYSEPSIYITSAQSDSGALVKRYRRRRKRSPKFGYNIKNVDEFLSRCSLINPANIPVVLSNPSILYQTRSGYHQVEIPLPLGMVVNSVFKNQNWLYVQTPHGEEGYISFNSCLPLGIIPNSRSTSSPSKPKPCWESNVDIFPNPCGNLTDSEKELQMRSGTRSEGRRTPKLRRSSRSCSEKYLDSLYLRAASQPKVIDHSYAQLKPTNKCKLTNLNNLDDYAQLKYNHDKVNINTKRQILLAITENYSSDMIQVKEGDVVSLLACKEYQDKDNIRQWYFVRTRDGFEGYIPSSITDEFL